MYFGLPGFNARARATNFDLTSLSSAMAFLHEHGRKGYVTLNTLVFDDELPAVEAAIRACAAAGVDAVIVQDFGVAKLVAAIAPTLAIHASTQMTCTDAGSVEMARSLGAERVILARELSLEDIAAIRRESDVELEVFVHGALCISYSGQCLTSEAIGGRSANRGACAQACRLPYELVVDGELRLLGDRAFLLSPEDLEAADLVPKLVELGVSSIKIEGRLKGPEYVGAAAALYRQAVDAAVGEGTHPDAESRATALQMFSRGSGPGFFAGIDHQRLVEARTCDHRGLLAGATRGVRDQGGRRYLAIALDRPLARGDGILVEGGFGGKGEIGGRVWALLQNGADAKRVTEGEALVWLGPDQPSFEILTRPDSGPRRVFITSDPAREKQAQALAAQTPRRRVIDLFVRGAFGECPEFSATSRDGITASVMGEAALEKASARPFDEALARDKLGQLGETAFELGEVRLELPAGAFLPLSSLKRARRALVDALVAASARAHRTTTVTSREVLERASIPDRQPMPAPPGLFVVCRNEVQARAAFEAGADGVYLDFLELTGTGDAFRALRSLAPRADSASGAAGARRRSLGVAPPRIRKPSEEKIDRYLDSLEPDMVLVRGLGALFELEARRRNSAANGKIAPIAIADFSLNATNAITAGELLARGASAFVPSFDLDAAQLVQLLKGPLGAFAEVVLHHPMPLFHMEHCVIAALLSEGRDHKTCGRPCERHQLSLRDRAGMDHPVEADVGCRNTVFHARAQSAADVVPTLRRSGVARFRIELVRETAAEVTRIVTSYRRLIEGASEPAETWRELRIDSGYGVVRGSLRVLQS